MRREIESGSPRPEIELTLDPLGLITPSLKPFAGNAAMETDQPLTSPDSTMRVFPMVTNKPSISAFDCQKLMKQVNAFRTPALEGWDGGKLEVFITGRSAYVAEISLSMRHDIVATVLSSIALVGAVFFIGFRRWLPLLGMGFALLLCCLIGLAAGLLIFHRLNMVTVGFCAILVGLGVDFAILIYGRYQQARNEGDGHRVAVADAIHSLGRAVFFGALTTAVGFLALVLSNSSGFIQLGVLIAIGISAAGLLMTTVFFLFVPRGNVPLRSDWILGSVRTYVHRMLARPQSILAISAPILIALSGGGDSTALLHLLTEAMGAARLRACVVDHALRDGSAEEADVVRDIACVVGAAFRAERVEVAPGPNLEARARDVQYVGRAFQARRPTSGVVCRESL